MSYRGLDVDMINNMMEEVTYANPRSDVSTLVVGYFCIGRASRTDVDVLDNIMKIVTYASPGKDVSTLVVDHFSVESLTCCLFFSFLSSYFHFYFHSHPFLLITPTLTPHKPPFCELL